VSVIVPCFNEQEALPSLLDRLDRMHENGSRDWSVVAVDDGSDDDTFAQLLRARVDRPWLDVLRHQENLGLGAALRTGFAYAQSPIVCTIDSDCTYPPERLPELTALLEGGVDLATASAWHPTTLDGEPASVRRFLSRAVSNTYKLLIGQDIYTFTCLFRAYRSDLLEGIHFRANGYGAVAEIMLRSLFAGAAVAEVAMPLGQRRHGESKLKVGDAVAAHAGLLTLTSMLLVWHRVRRAGRRIAKRFVRQGGRG